MRNKKCQFFPQNLRKKTAEFLKIFFFLLFSFYFLLNLHSELYPENEELAQAKKGVLASPFGAKNHLNLAKIYLEMGNLGLAEKELSLAQDLGATFSADLKTVANALEIAKSRSSKIRQEISFWEKVVKEKPDYRDAYFQLAVLNYQLNHIKKAKEFLLKTLEIDPNFESAKKLEKILNLGF